MGLSFRRPGMTIPRTHSLHLRESSQGQNSGIQTHCPVQWGLIMGKKVKWRGVSYLAAQLAEELWRGGGFLGIRKLKACFSRALAMLGGSGSSLLFLLIRIRTSAPSPSAKSPVFFGPQFSFSLSEVGRGPKCMLNIVVWQGIFANMSQLQTFLLHSALKIGLGLCWPHCSCFFSSSLSALTVGGAEGGWPGQDGHRICFLGVLPGHSGYSIAVAAHPGSALCVSSIYPPWH
jgi:hypothetical protein